MSRSLPPGAVYVQNYISGKSGNLYRLDLTTGNATQVGKLATEVYDIAFVDTELYGLAKKDFGFRKTMRLVKLDPTNGKLETVGNTQFDVVGLAYNPVRKALCASAHRNSQIVQINLDTGKATPIATLSDRDRQCGEIAFDAAGQAYITLIGNDLKKYLATFDLSSGQVELMGDIGFPGLASMKFIGDTLYGVAGEYRGVGGSDGQVIRIDTATGQGTLITTTEPALCWAGMAVYAAASANVSQPPKVLTDDQTSSNDLTSAADSKEPVSATNAQTQPKDTMALLTIDTKDNCYVINPDEMNNLQANVANSFTCDQGTFDIQITGGRYSYNAEQTEGEPFVLLWIYGLNNSTFVNKNTGIEVGTTWTTLNGLSDRLQIEVKERAVICALFFDTNSSDNTGTVDVTVSSDKPYFSPRTLTVDSQRNCYPLSGQYLQELQQTDKNLVELLPGNYRLKIRESNASYWSSEEKFQLEPWALLWIQGGKVIPKLTGVEVKETWCSLNGLKDELILEVKETIKVSGFFLDTFKDDNEGQIILEVEPISDRDLETIREARIAICGPGPEAESPEISVGAPITSDGDGVEREPELTTCGPGTTDGSDTDSVTINRELVEARTSDRRSRFNFELNQSEIEETWRQIAQNVESSLTISVDQSESREAYWQNLEKGLLKSYQQQAKEMAIKVARVEFMMNAYTQQIEGSFNQIFQGWSSYFDSRLTEIVDRQLPNLIEQQVNARFSYQAQEVKKLVVEQMQSDMEKRIEAAINVKLTQHSQEVKRLVVEQMQSEIEQRIETIVTSKTSDQTLEISGSVIEQIQAEMDKRIDAIVVLKSNEQSESLKQLITQQIQANLDERVEGFLKLKLQAQTDDIKGAIVQQIQAEIDKRLEAVVNLKVTDQSESLKTLITRQVEAKLEKRIQVVVDQLSNTNVDAIINSITNDIDSRINANVENKILNFRQNVSTIVQNEINTEYTESLKTTLLSDIQNQQFYLDMQSIKSEVMNFYARLGQFETQLNMRIAQGDARVYNWTLEQLTMLQACITDRQTLADMLDDFSSRLRSELDETPCVQPDRFTSWLSPEGNPELAAGGTTPLPEGR
ncbi:MAG: hypothetical protein AAGD09_04900 [Cyanobacteria bacterium P01_F01_bin.56]